MSFTCKKFYKILWSFPYRLAFHVLYYLCTCVWKQILVCIQRPEEDVWYPALSLTSAPETGSSGPPYFCTQCWATSFLHGPEDLNLGLSVCTSSPLLTEMPTWWAYSRDFSAVRSRKLSTWLSVWWMDRETRQRWRYSIAQAVLELPNNLLTSGFPDYRQVPPFLL